MCSSITNIGRYLMGWTICFKYNLTLNFTKVYQHQYGKLSKI